MAELIIMFFCGFFFAVAIMGIVVTALFTHEELDAQKDEDVNQMYLWYDANYGKENDE